MCGIVIVAQTQPGRLNERAVCEMRDVLAHRGPDDSTFETVDSWVALGHRRLSVIDVAGASQPLRSEDGNVVCIFNGEIYNFEVLRSRLRALGHEFLTAGDGEVIVHGYEQWGDGVFSLLEGMFALALVDRRQRRLLLVRDRFGIKPLFYQRDALGVRAASEIKSLIRHATPQASRTALAIGSIRMHIPWPLTAFDGIYRVPPGAALEIRADGEVRLFRAIEMSPRPGRVSKTSPEHATEVLRTAVARQLVADVPVGAFLSGGVDSTLIVALMRQITPRQIHTFSISTHDQNESPTAARTANELQTTHHTIPLEEIAFEDLMVLPRLFDEPFAETSALGVRALSRFARDHVTVALSGDGGDEVFGGYDTYRWIQTLNRLNLTEQTAAPTLARRLLMLRPWPTPVRRALRAMLLLGEPGAAQRDASTLSWAADGPARAASDLLSARIEQTCGGDIRRLDAARHAMLTDRLENLPNAMLSKVDTASMSASLEVRVPMLDDLVVRYADEVPTSELMNFRHGKLLLRRALERLPGGRVAWAPKRGFALPLARWMRGPAVEQRLAELFGDSAHLLQDLTGTDVVALWSAFRAGRSSFSEGTAAMQLLWFANVALWADRFHVRSAVESVIDTAPLA